MAYIESDKEMTQRKIKQEDEEKLLKEIEQSFCTAGYDVLEAEISRKLDQSVVNE